MSMMGHKSAAIQNISVNTGWDQLTGLALNNNKLGIY